MLHAKYLTSHKGTNLNYVSDHDVLSTQSIVDNFCITIFVSYLEDIIEGNCN